MRNDDEQVANLGTAIIWALMKMQVAEGAVVNAPPQLLIDLYCRSDRSRQDDECNGLFTTVMMVLT